MAENIFLRLLEKIQIRSNIWSYLGQFLEQAQKIEKKNRSEKIPLYFTKWNFLSPKKLNKTLFKFLVPKKLNETHLGKLDAWTAITLYWLLKLPVFNSSFFHEHSQLGRTCYPHKIRFKDYSFKKYSLKKCNIFSKNIDFASLTYSSSEPSESSESSKISF